MYTMLVVDDNPSDRMGICSLLNWNDLGIEIVGTCSNGAKALSAVNENKIDIVLTDIAMPIMNGIELAEKIKTSHMHTKIVFMSCYSDFEYARSAMDLDIYGYVLKPIIPDELLKVMVKLMQEYADEEKRIVEKDIMTRQIRDMLPMVQEQFLKELLLGSCYQRDEILKQMDYLMMGIDADCLLYVVSLQIDDFDKQIGSLSTEDKYYLIFSIKNLIASQSTGQTKLLPVQFSGSDYACIVFHMPGMSSNHAIDIMDIAVGIHDCMSSILKLNTTLGISKYAENIEMASELYRQSKEAVNTQFYGGLNPIIRYELIESGRFAVLDHAFILEDIYRQIKELITAGDEKAYHVFLTELFHMDETILPETYVRSLAFSILNMTAVVLMEARSSFKEVLGSDTAIWEKVLKTKSISSVQQLMMDVFRRVNEYFAEKSNSRNTKMIEAIKHTIGTRYREQINVEDIAKSVFLSQGYANALFKKETGISIFDYLLQYRLDKAKALLMVPDSKVTMVSESVGYENKSYFSLMFKKYIGMSPSDYKARFVK